MAFESTQVKNKAMFVARLVSRKTGTALTWLNPIEAGVSKVFGKKVIDLTAEEARYYYKNIENEYFELIVTDTTVAPTTISIEDL